MFALNLMNALPDYGWHGPGWFIIIPIFWMLLIIFCIAGFARRRRWTNQSLGAEGVLRERYARGEIDEGEYRQRLEVLRTKLK